MWFSRREQVGNFVTRPLYKRAVRTRHALFHAANRMAARLGHPARLGAAHALNMMWKAIAVVQLWGTISCLATTLILCNRPATYHAKFNPQ